MNEKELLHNRVVMQSAERAVDPSQFPAAFTDIHYAGQHEDQVLDVFLPEAEGVWPVVVFVHGGGWNFGGRREECISSIFKIVSQGYAVATVDYRLVPDAVYPEQIYDVKAAIRYLRAHAAELHINTDKLVVWGNSAGAHLAALAGGTKNTEELENPAMGNAEYSGGVDGVLAWYGVYDFATNKQQLTEQYPDRDTAGDQLQEAMLHGLEYEASPINHVDENYPKTLLQQGKMDKLVPWKQTEEFAEYLRRVCGPDRVEVDYVPTAGHGDKQIKSDENILRCVKFLDSIYFADRPCTYERKPLPELRFVASTCTRIDPFEAVD